MRFIKILSVFLCAAFIALNLAACGSDYKDAFIYVELEAKPDTLDPQLANSKEELTVVRSLFDTLLRYDQNGNIVPSAAESYEKKGNTYTFKLRTDATWHDGVEVTANDFVFAFKRAVDPITSAPYANSLSAIENAEEIMAGTAPLSSLGVKATDDYTLVITLKKDDPEFEKVLTSAITMPCNEEYFNACKGKYGLTIDTTPSNGSYYIRKWTTETKYLIRLAKNLEYNGPFEANSMRIYFTCSENSPYSMLEQDNTDLVYISTEEYKDVAADFKVSSIENVCYALFLNENLNEELRTAFLATVSSDSFNGLLDQTKSPASTLYPSALSVNAPKVESIIKYDKAAALEIYSALVKNGFSVNELSVKYPSDPTSESVAKAVAAHWQQTLSCFINIEPQSESNIQVARYYKNYDIIIAPLYSASGTVSAYNSALGFNGADSQNASKTLFENRLAYPLFYSTTNIAAGLKIQNLDTSIQNGILDVSLLIKEQ